MVSAPVFIILLLFVLLFDYGSLSKYFKGGSVNRPDIENTKALNHFTYIYLLLFVYYIMAITFFGHYQERYRMPVMVCFIIPLLAVFISRFDKSRFWQRPGIYIRTGISVILIVIWSSQACIAMKKKERLYNAIEQTEVDIGINGL